MAVVGPLQRARRRLPRPLRVAALRLLGRGPVEPERVIDLRLPAPPTSRVDQRAPTGERLLRLRTPQRTYVSGRLEEAGLAGYEPETLACFLAAVEELDASCVYDVGANIGVFSWLAAAFERAEVVAFEPTPGLALQLWSICATNGLSVVVERLALGARPGSARLYLSDKTDSSNSLRAGFRRSHRSVKVRVETIDRYAARTGRRPQVLKIDTESTEPDVLRGATRLLAEGRPWIVCEVLAGRTEAELMEILRPLHYGYYRIDDDLPLRRRETIEGDPTYAHMNWLFAPVDPTPGFWERMAAWRRSLSALDAPIAPPHGEAALPV
jgi:FkbM family methyltransferase